MPLLKLKYQNETPPGYWRFPRKPELSSSSDPRDFIWGGDLQDLIAKVHSYRVANGLDLGSPEQEVQDWICRNTGAQCLPANPPTPVPGRKARGADVARFMSAMVSWMKSNETVPQAEAESRAELCSNCIYNADVDDAGCLGCFGMAARVMTIIGDRNTRVSSALKFCNVCGCSNAVQAFVPMSVLAKAHKLEEFPLDIGCGVKCWKRAYADSLQTTNAQA